MLRKSLIITAFLLLSLIGTAVPVARATAPVLEKQNAVQGGVTGEKEAPKPKPTIGVPTILQKIAYCESGNRQFNADGSVLRGRVNPQDVGRFQINLTVHASEAKALGYDLFTWEGNTRFALWLYNAQGTQPWVYSQSCWGGII